MSDNPILMIWDGEHMTPDGRVWAGRADKQFVVGERYFVEAMHERSMASHRQYFASLNEAWRNLPEDQSERFPTVEHLRKYALINCGFTDERSIVCASKAEALRVAAFIRPMDTYAIVAACEATVKVWTAKSQSMRAMGREEFSRSKNAVLDFIASIIGVTSETLNENAGQAS